MDIGLVGKTALITGGSSGVGRAIALALAAEGTHIAIADLNKDDTLLQEIQALGAHAFYVPTDVSNESHINLYGKNHDCCTWSSRFVHQQCGSHPSSTDYTDHNGCLAKDSAHQPFSLYLGLP